MEQTKILKHGDINLLLPLSALLLFHILNHGMEIL